jgi:hypothetical protein
MPAAHCALVAALFALACARDQPGDAAPATRWDDVFAAVSQVDGVQCLSSLRALAPGRTVRIMLPDRHEWVDAEVVGALDRCAGEVSGLDLFHAQLRSAALSEGDVGIAVAAPDAELPADPGSWYFRACTSHEGVHLAVWNAQPPGGDRLWHAYHYLGYDVEPTCTDDDVSSDDDA